MRTNGIRWLIGEYGKQELATFPFAIISLTTYAYRPLTDEMLYYARCDTHYLLYVYDLMRNELVKNSDTSNPEKNLIEFTLQRSKETSLDRYTYWVPDPATGEGGRGWANSLLKSYTRLDGPQFAVYRAVHAWRDELARREDESPIFIMPPQVLMDITRLLPSDPKALWSLLSSKCAVIVPQKLDELFDIIVKAKEAGANGPTSTQYFKTGLLDNSLAAVAQREFGQKEKVEPDLPPVQELRSQQSQLFGSIPVSSRWDKAAATPLQSASVNQLIPLPWTSFVQEAAVSAAQQEAEAKARQRQQAADMILLVDPAPAPAKAQQEEVTVEDTEFTLRQGRKRKLEDVQVEDDSDSGGGAPVESQDMIMLSEDAEDPTARKARKKAEKKARKAASKAMKIQAKQDQATARKANKNGAANDDEDDEQPFDYSTAQSVLHAQRSAANTVVSDKGKKAFDPYAARMAAEGPKPARRMHGERTGKTATFRK